MPRSNYEAVTKRRIVEHVKANPRKSGTAIARDLGLTSKRVNQFLYYESKPWGLVEVPVPGKTYKYWVHQEEQQVLGLTDRERQAKAAREEAERDIDERIKRSNDWLLKLSLEEVEALFAAPDYELRFNDSEKVQMIERLAQLRNVCQKRQVTAKGKAAQRKGIAVAVVSWFLTAFVLLCGPNGMAKAVGIFMFFPPYGWWTCAFVATAAGKASRQRLAHD